MGIVSKIFGWITHPINDDSTTVSQWLAGLVVIFILAFLWTTVLREIE
jgi:hypothetical protein